jgi:hypothetical protein
MFHPWMKVTAYFHRALDCAYFHIRGEKNQKNMTQPSLTFLRSALSITEQRKQMKTNHDPLMLLQQCSSNIAKMGCATHNFHNYVVRVNLLFGTF